MLNIDHTASSDQCVDKDWTFCILLDKSKVFFCLSLFCFTATEISPGFVNAVLFN